MRLRNRIGGIALGALAGVLVGAAGGWGASAAQTEPSVVGYDPLASALESSALERAAGHLDTALAAADRALSVAPRDPAAWLVRAELLVDLGRHGEAIEALDELIAARGESARALTARARAKVGAGDRSGAEQDARGALALYPASGPARAELIELLRSSGRPEEARAQLTRLRLQAPDLAWAVASDARLRAAQGHVDAALAELEAALAGDDAIGSVRRATIEIALDAGRAGRAVNAADPWLVAPSSAPDVDALVLAARAARASGRELQALRASLAALDRDGASAAALDATVELLGESDRLVETLLRSRLERDDDNLARAWLGRRALDDGRVGEALELLGEQGATAELQLLRAEALRRGGRESEAIAVLEPLCAAGGPARAFYERALARFALGQLELAAADFERAASGELSGLAQFNRGAVLDRLGRYTEAVAAYEAAVAAQPDMAQAWMQLGNDYHFRLGDRARAAAAYRRFLAVAGEDAQVRAWLQEVE
ncbi:tetratricopeptide repeat protein [Engelhardtia mirabilis]|uniref:Tetratricopeptide repeat protein n=1 Tax=Engelhardtia mirabilis TaxID=2528011 RepID=A0A518BNL2_9BACT|nr:Tetratricopeptide repeat protein [Planctomycetes bacterium Pla133]QDV02894.1 Tetratricopeptide repeat protein [Planctomycetes bacterium Pla86]